MTSAAAAAGDTAAPRGGGPSRFFGGPALHQSHFEAQCCALASVETAVGCFAFEVGRSAAAVGGIETAVSWSKNTTSGAPGPPIIGLASVVSSHRTVLRLGKGRAQGVNGVSLGDGGPLTGAVWSGVWAVWSGVLGDRLVVSGRGSAASHGDQAESLQMVVAHPA